MDKISTVGMSRADWLAERRKSLGGSDMGGVLGMSAWASPYSIWADKTSRLPEKQDTEPMRQGRDLEQYVTDRFCEATGLKAVHYNYMLRNPDVAPYLHANIDRRVYGENAGLECKVTSAFNLRSYRYGHFPENYYAQCVTYLAVTEWDRWYLAVLIAGRDFKIFRMTTVPGDPVPDWLDPEHDLYVGPGEIQALKAEAKRFWETYITKDAPPPVDGSRATGDAIATIWADSRPEETGLPFGQEELLADYLKKQRRCKAIKAEMELIKQTVQEDMGEFQVATGGGYTATWKPQTKKSLNVTLLRKEHPEINPLLDEYYTEKTSRVFKVRENEKQEEV